jgi:hypothetical protein
MHIRDIHHHLEKLHLLVDHRAHRNYWFPVRFEGHINESPWLIRTTPNPHLEVANITIIVDCEHFHMLPSAAMGLNLEKLENLTKLGYELQSKREIISMKVRAALGLPIMTPRVIIPEGPDDMRDRM